MRRLGIGEVCRLLDIRPHILRYWEQEFPFLDPPKNTGGRRVYGDREINLLYRIKFLIHERRFTLEGAKKAILDESSDSRSAGLKADLQALRTGLLDGYGALSDLREKSAVFTDKTVFPEGQNHLLGLWKRLSQEKRRRLVDDLLGVSRRTLDLTASLLKASRSEILLPKCRAGESLPGEVFCAEAVKALNQGRLAAATLYPEGEFSFEALSRRLAELALILREASYLSGRLPYWYIFVPQSELREGQSLFYRRRFFGYDPAKLVFVGEPLLPVLDENFRLLLAPSGRLHVYPSGNGGALLMLKTRSLLKHFAKRGIDLLGFLPLNGFSRSFPDPRLLNSLLEDGTDVAFVYRTGEKVRRETTGVYMLKTDFLREDEAAPDFLSEERTVKTIIIDSASADAVIAGDKAVRFLRSGPFALLTRTGSFKAFPAK